MRISWLWLAAAVAAAGCSDALEQASPAGQKVAVLSAGVAPGSHAVTFVDAGDFTATPFVLPPDTTNPTALAAREGILLLLQGSGRYAEAWDAAGGFRRVDLAAGAAPVAAAFESDTVAWFLNGGTATVTRANAMTGDTLGSFAAGPKPASVVVTDSAVFAVSDSPAVIVARRVAGGAADTIALTGTHPGAAVVGDDSLIYVLTRGDSGQADGRLSIVDPAGRREAVVVNGLGERPAGLVYHPSGRVLVASPTDGILEVDALTRALTRGPGSGVMPGGQGVAALAFDARGRIYALAATSCAVPGVVYVLSAPPDYRVLKSVTVGACPSAAVVVNLAGTP